MSVHSRKMDKQTGVNGRKTSFFGEMFYMLRTAQAI